MGFESAFNQHFRSEIVATVQIWTFEPKFNLYQKLVKFNQNWSKMTGFCHFQCCFWYKSTFNWLIPSFNWSFLQSFNRNRLILDRKRSILDQIRLILYRNRNRRFGFVVGFRIGLKSTIEIDRLEIRIVNNSICKP